MNEEIRKPVRPRKEAQSVADSQPSAVQLAAMALPAIIAQCGAHGVAANCKLAMEYAETLLTLDGE